MYEIAGWPRDSSSSIAFIWEREDFVVLSTNRETLILTDSPVLPVAQADRTKNAITHKLDRLMAIPFPFIICIRMHPGSPACPQA